MSNATATINSPAWYQSLTPLQWRTVLASNLGWVFDGFETYALILTVGTALHQLLAPSQYSQIPTFAGGIIATTLIGWALGGIIGGVLADYIGRKQTMILAILTYSIMTGVSAFAWDWQSFAVMRFLVGLAIGSEWVTGASMTAEFWPAEARGRGAGLFQCGFGIGFFLASVTWVFVGATGPGAWRTMYLIGVLPALLTLWIRHAIPESPLWERANEQRRTAAKREQSGEAASAQDRALTRFTLAELFVDPEIRRRTIVALLTASFGSRLLGNFDLGAPLCRVGRSESWPLRTAMGQLYRHDFHRGHDRRLHRLWLPRRRLWTKADNTSVHGAVPCTDSASVLLDDRPDHGAVGRCIVGMLFVRAIHVDFHVAARTLSNADSRDRRRLRVQRGASPCRFRSPDCGCLDRPIRRLR